MRKLPLIALAFLAIACAQSALSYSGTLVPSYPRPYLVPIVESWQDFATVVYIDPDAVVNGSGATESDPLNTLTGLTFQSDTAYLFKRGTVMRGSIVNPPSNTYFGNYGDSAAPNPRLFNDTTVIQVTAAVDNIVFDGLDCDKRRSSGNDAVVEMTSVAGRVTFAHLRLRGVAAQGTGDSFERYPTDVVRGLSQQAVFYDCELRNAYEDGIYSGANSHNLTMVSCYIRGVNAAPTGGVGDCVQVGDGSSNMYFANNFMDRGDTAGKYCLAAITSTGTDNVAEWNTFIGPQSGGGGAAVYWNVGANSAFRYNLMIVKETGVSGLHVYDGALNEGEPYGVRDNHFLVAGGMFYPGDTTPPSSNVQYTSNTAFLADLNSGAITRFGSDLFPIPADPHTPLGLIVDDIVSGAFHLSWIPALDEASLSGYTAIIDGQPWILPLQNNRVFEGWIGGGMHTAAVCGRDTNNQLSDPTATLQVTIPGDSQIPPGWFLQEAPVLKTAELSASNGSITLSSVGKFTSYSDHYGFLSTQLTGDGSISCRVTALENTHAWARAGVMIRTSQEVNSPYASVNLTATGLLRRMSREDEYYASVDTAVAQRQFPYWVKLTRTGNTITYQSHADGASTWNTIATQTIPLGTTPYVGLFVFSNDYNNPATATFDNVQVTGNTGSSQATPLPPTNLRAVPGTHAVTLSWDAPVASVFPLEYVIYRNYIQVGTTTSTSWTDTNVTILETYNYTVASRDPSQTLSNTSASVTTQVLDNMHLSPEWDYVDIGSVTSDGWAMHNGSGFTFASEGYLLDGWDDMCGYLYQKINGNCEIVVYVDSVSQYATKAIAGVMFRSSLDPDAASALIGNNGLYSPGRLGFIRSFDGAKGVQVSMGSKVTKWVRVVRADRDGVSYISTYKGNSATGPWTMIGETQVVHLPTEVYAGLGIVSWQPFMVNEATVSSLNISPTLADTTRPNLPASITRGADSRSVTIRWPLSTDNVAVDHYRLYRNGNLAGSSRYSTFVDAGRAPGTYYNYELVAVDEVGLESLTYGFGQQTSGTVETLPEGFYWADIGKTTIPGRGYLSGNAFTLQGSGFGYVRGTSTDGVDYRASSGEWLNTGPMELGESMGFAYTPVTGDFELKVYVDSIADTAKNPLAGLMIRSGLEADAQMLSLLTNKNARTAQTSYVSIRQTDGADSSGYTAGISGAGSWLRIRRYADLFFFESSKYGQTWVSVSVPNPILIDMPDTVYVGMAVSSQELGQVTTARLTNFELIQN